MSDECMECAYGKVGDFKKFKHGMLEVIEGVVYFFSTHRMSPI